jgi:hypothetical protein
MDGLFLKNGSVEFRVGETAVRRLTEVPCFGREMLWLMPTTVLLGQR